MNNYPKDNSESDNINNRRQKTLENVQTANTVLETYTHTPLENEGENENSFKNKHYKNSFP